MILDRILPRLLLGFLLLSPLPLGSLAWFCIDSFERALTETVIANLESIADKKTDQINTYLAERLVDSRVTAASLAAADLLQSRETALDTSLARRDRDYLLTLIEAVGYYDLELVNLAGVAVFALRSGDAPAADHGTALALAHREALAAGDSVVVPFEPDSAGGDPALFIVSPVMVDGRPIGTLALHLGLAKLTAVTHDATGLGTTGETFLAMRADTGPGNADGAARPADALRYIAEGDLHHRLSADTLGLAMEAAIAGRPWHGVAADHHGNDVIAVSRTLPALRWGMVVKIDAAEALAPVARLRSVALGVLGLLILVAGLAGLYAGRGIVRPIVALTTAARRFAHGDLAPATLVGGWAEVRELAAIFNHMAARLRADQASLERRVAERTAALEQFHAQFDKIARTVPGILYHYGRQPNGSTGFHYVGPRTHDLLEVEAADVLRDQTHFWRLIHPDDQKRLQAEGLAARRAGTTLRSEVPITTPSGRHKWIEITARAAPPDPERPAVWSGIILDITDRRRAEQALQDSETRLRSIFEQASTGIAFAEPEGRLIQVNAEFSRLVGYPAPTLAGMTLADLLHPDDGAGDGFPDRGRPGSPDDAIRVERRFLTGDHRVVWVDCAISAIRNQAGRRSHSVILATDITEAKATLARLRVSEDQLRQMVEGTPLPTLATQGPNQRVIHLNQRFTEVIGYSLEDMPDADHWWPRAYPDPDYRAQVVAAWNAAIADGLATGRPARPVEAAITCKDGAVRIFEVHLRVIGDQDLIVFVDLTDRKRTEARLAERERFIRTVADHLPGMVGYWDASLCCRFANRTYRDWFGRDADAMLGTHIRTLLGEKLFALNEPYIRGALAGESQSFERTLTKTSGDIGHTWAQYIPDIDRDGQVHGFIVMVSDVTVIKQARLRLEEVNRQLVEAKDKAESASRAKSAFLANMSHEIRTPLNAVLGLSQVLARTTLSADQHGCLDQIIASGRSLLGILNDILDFSKVEAGRMVLERVEFSLDEVLANLASILGINARERALEVLIGADPNVPRHLIGDPLRLQQVLINLSGNAIKFTDRGEVVIGVTLVGREDRAVILRFSVRDTGIGIPEEIATRLFRPFEQADSSTTRRFGGTGLGLAISSRLVELMGGEIGVDSVPGQGSTFHFTARFDSTAARPAPVRGPVPLSVLVVDDHPIAREVLLSTVTGLGWRGAAVGSGAEALARLRETDETFDVLLLDWRMPGMDGIETAEAIRSRVPNGTAPIILMVTAHDRDQLAPALAKVAIDGILVKPIAPSHLLDAALNAAARRREGRETSPATPALPARSLHGRSILVVEDNLINQTVARRILETEGARVETAGNGEQALNALEAAPDRFDLILMDIQMPVLDGFQTTRRIREVLKLTDLPIVALTAGAFTEHRDQCLAAGMNDFVAKPFDVDQLIATVARHSGRAPGPARNGAAEPAGSDPPTSHLPAIPGINLNDALARTGGDADLLRSLLLSLATQYDAVVPKARALAAAGSRSELARLAHSLRGSAGTLGVMPLGDAAAALEKVLDAGGPDATVTGALDALEAAAGILTAIRAALPEPVPPPPTPAEIGAAGDLAVRLADLRRLLAAGNVEALALYDRLRPAIGAVAGEAAGRRLDAAMAALDVESALAELDLASQDTRTGGPGLNGT